MPRWLMSGFLLLNMAFPAAADEPDLAGQYGFLSPEIYKVENRINNLGIRDLDGDGAADIAVVNNARSRIDLLLTGGEGRVDDPAAGRPDDVNYVPSDRRMRLVSVPVNREVVSLRLGDVDGDGRADLVYYGSPAELVVLPNLGRATFGEPKRVDVPEAVPSSLALDVGDVTGDGKPDLALLTPTDVVIVAQRPEGDLAEPERLPHSAAKPVMLRLVDLDGDDALDLVLIDGSTDHPLRVRFGNPGGPLGPEERLAMEEPRAVAFAEIDEKPGHELLTIEARSGRARILRLGGAADSGEGRQARVRGYPMPAGGTRERSVALGDLDGDGKTDVVATDPARAQVLVYPQTPDGPGPARPSPSLAGLKAVRAADLDGDGKAEVVVLSEAEKQLGWSRFAEGRLSFPAALPVQGGEPLACELADLDGDGRPEVLYAVASAAEPGGRVFDLRALRLTPPGTWSAFRWGDAETVPVRKLNGPPSGLRVVDVDGDHRADILVFHEYGTPVLLRGQEQGPPAVSTAGPGPLADADPARIGPPPPGEPGLLVTRGGFARHVALDASGQWVVRDQFSPGRSDVQLTAAAILPGAEGRPAEVALLDRSDRALRFLTRTPDGDRSSGRVETGPLDIRGMHVADLNGDSRPDLLLAGPDRFLVILNGRAGPKLEPIVGYESAREDAHLGDLVAGDVNGDGHNDLVLSDTGEHFIEIAAYRPEPPNLNRALAFQIYERKSFRDPDRNVEPRDLALGDVDGDGLRDLVLIVHDRILVYRQDRGPESKPVEAAR